MLARFELDFWNNPLVVSALRIRMRRSTSIMFVTAYLLLLGVGCAFIHQYRSFYPDVWAQICLAAVLGVQTVVSSVIALSTVSSSMQAEVLNRTLDFQRIAAISPLRILVGKLFGEATMAFLLIAAGFPIAAVLAANGAAAPADISVVYLHVITTVLLAGAIGLIHPLEAPEGKTAGSSNTRGPVVAITLFACFVLPTMMQALPSAAHNPAVGAAISVLTPALGIYGLYYNELWQLNWQFFAYSVPFAVAAPVLQLGIVWVILIAMRRRMVNTKDPALDKTTALFVVAIVDLLIAGLLYDPSGLAPSVVVPACTFLLLHFFVTFLVAAASTPSRWPTESFFWRRRGPHPPNPYWGDRALNMLWAAAALLVGQVVLWGLVVGPAAQRAGASVDWAVLAQVAVAGVVIPLAALLLLQYLAMHLPKGAFWLVVVPLVAATTVPHVAGEYYNSTELLAFSPSAHFIDWVGGDGRISDWPHVAALLAPYLLLIVAVLAGELRRVRYLKAKVDARLASMGVGESAPQASV